MDTKRLVTRSIVGGILMFAIGYLLWGTLLAGFFEAHAGSASGVARDATIWWAAILGPVLLATLLSVALEWSDASSPAEGFKTGAIVGFLLWGGVDILYYGNLNLRDLVGSLTDPVIELFRFGIIGAVLVLIMARGGSASAAE